MATHHATSAFKTSTAITPLALLAACGGASGGNTTGSGSGSTAGTSGVIVTAAPPSDTEASRFLAQASMGATRASIAEVVAKGYAGWIDAQFAMPRPSSLWASMAARDPAATVTPNSLVGYDQAVWQSLIAGPDQLRQRVATALFDFLVTSMVGLDVVWINFAMAAYTDILFDGAFGNYRDLLERITFSPTMAKYLSSLNNVKANPATGTQPDENYARELMQLFSIGLYQLNMDGSRKLANGAPIETYTQRDVSQLARVMTGMTSEHWSNVTDLALTPLVVARDINETGPSTFLGTTVTGGGAAAIKTALDVIFNHANVAPFVSKQLIQRLVTSNPSPAYVQRVATVFADNGKGVRGDLQAVVKAILLDTEARNDDALTSTTAGRLRPPVQRLTAWARAFNVTSPSNAWAIGDTSNPATGIGQAVGHSPTVFNFFRPGYTPPGSEMQARGLVAPEFQIANEQSVISYVNFMAKLVSDGIGDLKPDYSALTAKTGDTGALVDEINVVLAAGQLSGTTIATIKGAVDSATGPAAKVNIAVLLTLAAPEFLVTR